MWGQQRIQKNAHEQVLPLNDRLHQENVFLFPALSRFTRTTLNLLFRFRKFQSCSHHHVVRVENRHVLEDVSGHADELWYDEANDGKHGNAPVLYERHKERQRGGRQGLRWAEQRDVEVQSAFRISWVERKKRM